jgi:hypothetical protein
MTPLLQQAQQSYLNSFNTHWQHHHRPETLELLQHAGWPGKAVGSNLLGQIILHVRVF